LLCYFQTLGKGDPWEWLWKRVRDPNNRDFENKILVWSLLSTAWKEGQHIRVLATYRDFEQIITSSWDEKWRARIDATIDDAEEYQERAAEADLTDR
jgi:hypothetical protein